MKTLRLDFIKCIIPKSLTFKHFLAFLPDAYLATTIPDMSGKNLMYGNPKLNPLSKIYQILHYTKSNLYTKHFENIQKFSNLVYILYIPVGNTGVKLCAVAAWDFRS